MPKEGEGRRRRRKRRKRGGKRTEVRRIDVIVGAGGEPEGGQGG
jgi:hypothetical protein